ncbi:ferritin [Acidobacteria bacterium AH-259-D05]|nr:ferritin [Acidobacteria bacterium AH-259-D05]
MPSKKLENAINEQIQSEFYSSYLYLAMSAYCEEINLEGFAHWMLAQSEEERGHSMRLFKYLHDRGGRVVLQAIGRPPSNFKSPRHMFEEVLRNEQEVTKEIHKLYSRDYPMVQALVLTFAVISVSVNFCVDILYKYANPRITLE